MSAGRINLTVRAALGRLSALSVFLCKLVLYGAFGWVRMALNGRKWRFSARAVIVEVVGGQLHFAFSPGGPNCNVRTVSPGVINDGKWHTVTATRSGPSQGTLRVDAVDAFSTPAGQWCVRATAVIFGDRNADSAV